MAWISSPECHWAQQMWVDSSLVASSIDDCVVTNNQCSKKLNWSTHHCLLLADSYIVMRLCNKWNGWSFFDVHTSEMVTGWLRPAVIKAWCWFLCEGSTELISLWFLSYFMSNWYLETRTPFPFVVTANLPKIYEYTDFNQIKQPINRTTVLWSKWNFDNRQHVFWDSWNALMGNSYCHFTSIGESNCTR